MPHMSQVSDLVKDAKLPTRLDAEYTTHTFLESTSVAGRRARRREREEIWKKKQHLGIGVFGTVWLEECAVEGGSRLRAVKEVCRVAPGSKHVDYSRELEAIAKFSQQRFDGCFVKSSGWFESAESVFICMEYLPLGDLQKYMVRPFAEDVAQHITLQLLEGLDFMHSNGFVHRDLKPQHIFVLCIGPDWWVKIGDFGVSKRVMEGLMGRQTFNRTPAFTPPEVYQHMWEPVEAEESIETQFTPESDIWSLGVITYYLLTGTLPFSTQSHLLAYSKQEASLHLETLVQRHITPEASAFLEKTLAPTPVQRLSARDALEHPWLVPLLEPEVADSEPMSTIAEEASVPPLQIQKPQTSQDVMLPGTVDLSPPSKRSISSNPSYSVSPTSPGISSDTYKQIINHTHPALMASLDQSTPDSSSIAQSQFSDSHTSESGLHPPHSRHVSVDTSPLQPLPPYIRRGSCDAPIPLSDLNHRPSTSESAGSNARHSTDRDRFSDRIRRVSRDIVPRRSRRSQDQVRIPDPKKGRTSKEKEKERSDDAPASPVSSTPSAKSKSHIVEIPGRPQFAEGLPMFPMRSKKA